MNTMIEIITIWLKIIGIIVLWEAWKYVGWELVNWWVTWHIKKHEQNKNKCPYFNKETNLPSHTDNVEE
jgi:hypothetical protein